MLSSSAWAYESEEQEMVFRDSYNVFQFLSFDTGYLPSQNDPISVRFHVTPTGGVQTELEAVSQVEWPDALIHRMDAIPGEGIFGINTDVDIGFDIYINLPGLYQDVVPVWSEGFQVQEGIPFDSLLLPGSPEAPLEVVVQDTSLVPPFEYAIDVLPGALSFVLGVSVYPEIRASMAGNRIETVNGSQIEIIDGEGMSGLLELNTGGATPAELGLQSTYYGDLESSLSLVIEPYADMETLLGDFTLLSFPIPIDFLETIETRAFTPQFYAHPLPALKPIEADNDVGEVDIGYIANLPVLFENVGRLGLEGWARIEGSETFTVFPEYLYATEGNSDGVVVTFEPDEAREYVATLIIETNDPQYPEVRIPLSGTGFDPNAPVDDGDPSNDDGAPDLGVNTEEIRGCNCNSAPTSAWLGLVPLLLVPLLRRKRYA